MNKRPATALFSEQQWHDISQLIGKLDPQQSAWLSDFLADQHKQSTPSQPTKEDPIITIAYGSETGNGRLLSQHLYQLLSQQSLKAKLMDLSDIKLRNLHKLSTLLIICSTHGDGDPPEPILQFFHDLQAAQGKLFTRIRYGVLALGDSSYDHFCATGKAIDQKLQELGATRIIERVDCDVDYHEDARKWMQDAIKALSNSTSAFSSAAPIIVPIRRPTKTLPVVDKNSPVDVEILENQALSIGNTRTHHIALDINKKGIQVSPGDAIGVFPHNPPELVSTILDVTGLSGDLAVNIKGTAYPLVQALREKSDLTISTKKLLQWCADNGNKSLAATLHQDPTGRKLLRSAQLVDILIKYPAKFTAQSFVDRLRPLQPRLYDIANCTQTIEDEIHLVVKNYSYFFNKRTEHGIASHYLTALSEGDQITVYPHPNRRFNLPERDIPPLILIAEGTGIAPYRAFVQSLTNRQTPVPIWIIYKGKDFEDDFYYQTEWQSAISNNVIHQFDTVFAKHQPGQSLLSPVLEQLEIFDEWCAKGAHIYLCGDKKELTTFENSISHHLHTRAEVNTHWTELSENKRVHRNLY